LLQVRDATGRLVRELRASDAGSAVWNGRGRDGRLLPAGVYFLQAGAGTGRRVAQVLFTR